MSTASLGDDNKVFKTSIWQDFVHLILRDLEQLNMNNERTNERTIKEIQGEVKKMTNFMAAVDDWQNQVLDKILMIKGSIRKLRNDDSNERMFSELENILVKIKKLEVLPHIDHDIKRPSEKASDRPPKNTPSEVGQSSNSSAKDPSSEKNDGQDVELEESIPNVKVKDCLYSLAIFPQNEELEKRLLVHWWIGLGLVRFEDNRSIEKIFSLLERKGILKQKRIKEHNRTVYSYTIDLEIYRKFTCKDKRSIVSGGKKGEDPLIYKDDKDNVIALLNLNQRHLNSRYIDKKPTTKVVQLGKWRYTDLKVHSDNIEAHGKKFWENMGETLTYLSLRGISRIEELPQSLGKIRCLKILDLMDCHSLQKLPQKPKSMIRAALCRDDQWFKELTYLDITGCYLLDHMPKWVCELSNLQVLKGAVFNCVIQDQFQDQFRLKDLSKLEKLIKLSIKIIHPNRLHPEDCNGLKTLSSLLVLTIVWAVRETGTTKQSRDSLNDGSNDSSNSSEKGDDKIPDVIEDQTAMTVNKSIENEQKELNMFRSIGKNLGRVLNKDKTVQKKQNKRTLRETGIPTISFPENLEKLDLRCCPYSETSMLLSAAKLKNLKRLYVRGGKLAKITDDTAWQVQILRLRYLKCLDLDWYKLGAIFTKLKYVEYKECPLVKFFPYKSSSWRTEIDGPFPTHYGPFDDEKVPHQNLGPFNNNEPILDPSSVPITLKIIPNVLPLDFQQKKEAMVDSEIPSKDVPVLDLVVVLDITIAMTKKLAILKTAMLSFIKDLLMILPIIECHFRLSIVTFGRDAIGQCGLRLLTENHATDLENLIKSFEADGNMNASDGLQMGLKVLNDRRFSKGHANGIMLVSGSSPIGYAVQVGDVSVHTFGLDRYDDGKVLEYMADNSHPDKTFTDALNSDDLRKVFHKCCSKFLKLMVQDLTLTLKNERLEARTISNVNSTDDSINLPGRDVPIARASFLLCTQKEISNILDITYSYKFEGVWFEANWAVTKKRWQLCVHPEKPVAQQIQETGLNDGSKELGASGGSDNSSKED